MLTRKLATHAIRIKAARLTAIVFSLEEMTMQDDELPPPPILSLTKAETEDLSVGELEARIVALEAEIMRVKDVIASKQDSKSAAEAVFGKS